MSVPEVANRATISGAIEIGRHPGVVQVTFRAPVDRLEACGLLFDTAEVLVAEFVRPVMEQQPKAGEFLANAVVDITGDPSPLTVQKVSRLVVSWK